MQGSRRFRSIPALVVCACLASGCSNLGAVRDFAATSARMTDYRDATRYYLDTADRELAGLPPDPRFDATRAQLEAFKAIAARDKDTLLQLHATTTGYMAALARLAGEDAYEISPGISKVAGALRASKRLGIDADHVRAFDNIAGRVSDWLLAARQARDVRRLVTENGADMDKLLEAMQKATEAYGIVLTQEIQSHELVADYRQAQWAAELPGDAALTPARRETLAVLLRRSERDDEAALQAAQRNQRAAAAGVKRVRQAHRDMLDHVDRLDSDEARALLRAAADDLKSIRASINALEGREAP